VLVVAETKDFFAWLTAYKELIVENADYLTDLDRRIGDADHGANMAPRPTAGRGMTAVAQLDPTSFADAGALLKKAGMTLVSKVGGASGPLYGTFFMRMGAALGSDADTAAIGKALRAGADGVKARGKANLGDKTMLDCLYPALDAFDEAAAGGLQAALQAASERADKAASDTEPMIAKKGRASYLGERSQGTPDPGATSSALLFKAAAAALA